MTRVTPNPSLKRSTNSRLLSSKVGNITENSTPKKGAFVTAYLSQKLNRYSCYHSILILLNYFSMGKLINFV